MLNTEERVLAVKLRVEKIEKEKRQRRMGMLSLGSVAFGLVFLVGLSFLMPSIMSAFTKLETGSLSHVASMFSQSEFLGYVLISFLAFALGVSLTILAYKLNQRAKAEQESGDD